MNLLDKLRLPVAGLGGLALLVTLGLVLVAGELSVPARLALAIAVLLFGVYVAIDPEKAVRSFGARQWVQGSNATVVSVAFVGILVLGNVLAQRYHARWDLTAQRDFSLSDATLKVLQELPTPVHAKAFFSGNLPDRRTTEDLLKEYAVRSDDKLTFEMFDTFQQPALARLENVNVDGTVLFVMGDKKQTTITSDEAHMTTALLKLVNPTPLKVYFVTGHGERDLGDTNDEGYSGIKTAIQGDNYTVDTLNLLARADVPGEANAVVIAGPKSPFLPEEIDALNRYLDRNGKLVLLVDPFADQSNITDVLKRWNLGVGGGVVVDPDSSLPRDPTVVIVQQYGLNNISKNLGTISVFPFTTNIKLPDALRNGVDVSGLALTVTNRSWMQMSKDVIQYNPATDTQGPLTLAASIEEVQNPLPSDQQPPPGFEDPNKKVKNRVVVFGSSEVVVNGLVNQPYGNKDFFLNALNWVTQTDQLITTRPKLPQQRPLFLTPVQSNFVFFSGTLFLPLILLGIGVFVWWMRR